MKKIIATVLAMVMALALCTTAFAATTETTLKAADYKLKSLTNAETKIETIVVKVTDKYVDKDDVTHYYADKYTINGTAYWVCDDSIATAKLVKGSTVIALTTVDVNSGDDGITETATLKAGVDDPACGEFEDDVFVIDGKTYVIDENGTAFAMLNGKAVAYGNEVSSKVNHDWTDKGVLTYNTKGEVIKAKCGVCNETYDVVKGDKPAVSYTGTYESLKVNGVDYVVLTGTTTTTTTDTTTATSPKTFDAGIAMYVGMALTSVAGSAVVIGKKKEF